MHLHVRLPRTGRHFGLFLSTLAFTVTACGYSTSPAYGGGGGGGGGGGCTSTSSQITIADFNYSPSCTTVPLNTTVTWTNNGPSAHTTTSDATGSTGWDSGNLAVNATFSHQFTSAGTFTYHSTNDAYLYPNFVGTITVTP